MTDPTFLAPSDEAGIAAAIRAAVASREPFAVQGNGTKAAMLRPVQAARTLSTRGLTGVTLHAPKELVISVRAGTPVTEVAAVLASGGQHLIGEPPDLGAIMGSAAPQTIGGVIATNLSGPRRIMAGAMRDHLIGVRFVNGEGEVIHSGGRVLKNVTGLDLCKLLAGSHGTLGVITEVTLKVAPAPEASGSLLLTGLEAAAGVAALAAALGSPYGVSGAAWLPAEAAARIGLAGGSATLIRIEEFTASVGYRLERLRTELEGRGLGRLLDQSESIAAWAAIRDAAPLGFTEGEAVWRVSTRPSRGPAVLAAAEAAGLRGYLDWGGGLVWLAGEGSAESHAAVVAAVGREGGVWTLLRAPDALRLGAAVVPPEPVALAAITQRVKAALDPSGLFNPGRIYAGL